MFPGSLYSAEKMWSKKGSRDGRMGGEWWQKAVLLHFALGTIHLAWCTRTFTLSVHLFELSLHLCSWVVNTTGKMNQVEERTFLAIIIANNWLASHELTSLLEGNDFWNWSQQSNVGTANSFFSIFKMIVESLLQTLYLLCRFLIYMHNCISDVSNVKDIAVMGTLFWLHKIFYI